MPCSNLFQTPLATWHSNKCYGGSWAATQQLAQDGSMLGGNILSHEKQEALRDTACGKGFPKVAETSPLTMDSMRVSTSACSGFRKFTQVQAEVLNSHRWLQLRK